MAKFCINCGNKLEENASFCTNCGTSVNGTEPSKNIFETMKEKSDKYTNGTEINIKNARKIFKDMTSNTNVNEKISTKLNKENISPKDAAKIKSVINSEIKTGKISEEEINTRLDELIQEFDTKTKEINDALINLNEFFESEEVQNKITEYNLKKGKTLKIKKDLKKEVENGLITKEEVPKKVHEKIDSEYEKEVEMGISGYDFTCTLYEIRQGTFGQKEDVVKGYCFLEKDKLTIKKISSWLKHDKGNKIIPFNNINAIDYDKAGGLQLTSSIVIGISGVPPIVLRHTSEEDFNLLHQAWLDYNNPNTKEQVVEKVTVEPQVSAADELMKYAELYEKGLLTEEEFNAMKKKLLGL